MDARGNSRRLAIGRTQKVGNRLASKFGEREDSKRYQTTYRRAKPAYNAAMRCRLAQIVVFAAACLWFGKPPADAQSFVSSAASEIQNESCQTFNAPDDDEPSGPEISLAEVSFSGVSQMPTSDQDQIAALVKRESSRGALDGLIDDAVERVRAAWQDHGYFKVLVHGDAKTLTSGPDSQRIALSVEVDEGMQYRLDKITFKNNKIFRDVELLRGLFPINRGDVFSREKIAIGLESLRSAYGELGYINFTVIPDTELDDVNRLASVDIDIDEGKQFHVGNVVILGLDEPARKELLQDFPMKPGQIFDGKLFASLLTNSALGVWDYSQAQDDKAGIVTVTFDFRPCPSR